MSGRSQVDSAAPVAGHEEGSMQSADLGAEDEEAEHGLASPDSILVPPGVIGAGGLRRDH